MSDYTEYYLMLPILLWIITYIMITVSDRAVKKKFGNKSEEYVYLRFPKFVALFLDSAATVGLILFVEIGTVTPELSTYFAVPYFGITAFFLTSVFRIFKDARGANGNKW